MRPEGPGAKKKNNQKTTEPGGALNAPGGLQRKEEE